MADENAVAILRRGVNEWNTSRRQTRAAFREIPARPDLREVHLGHADLSNVDLSDADLSGADLSYARATFGLLHLSGVPGKAFGVFGRRLLANAEPAARLARAGYFSN